MGVVWSYFWPRPYVDRNVELQFNIIANNLKYDPYFWDGNHAEKIVIWKKVSDLIYSSSSFQWALTIKRDYIEHTGLALVFYPRGECVRIDVAFNPLPGSSPIRSDGFIYIHKSRIRVSSPANNSDVTLEFSEVKPLSTVEEKNGGKKLIIDMLSVNPNEYDPVDNNCRHHVRYVFGHIGTDEEKERMEKKVKNLQIKDILNFTQRFEGSINNMSWMAQSGSKLRNYKNYDF